MKAAKKAAELSDRLRTDFVFFARMLWEETGRAAVAPIGPVEEDMMQWVHGGPPWRGVLAWRGFGKTELITCAYAAFRILQNPDIKILIVSKSAGFAEDAVRQIRDWVRNIWFLKHLDPEDGVVTSKRDRTHSFDVATIQFTRHPTVRGLGVDGQLQGRRANLVIADDTETTENTKTPESRLWLRKQIKEFMAIASFGRKEIIYIGTPQHEDSVYFSLARNKVAFRSWPARYPRADHRVVGLSPMLRARLDSGSVKEWDPVCPARFPEEALALLEESGDEAAGFRGGELWFMMQYMLVSDLAQSHRYPLRLSDLIVFDCSPTLAPLRLMYGKSNSQQQSTAVRDLQCIGFDGDFLYSPWFVDEAVVPYQQIRAGLDPAGRGRDKTGLSIVGQLGGLLYVLGCYGLDGGAEVEKLNHIAQLLRLHHAREVVIEENIDIFSQFENGLRLAIKGLHLSPGEDPAYPQGWTCSVKPTRAVRVQKEVRIISILEPLISRHRLVVDRNVIKVQGGDITNELQYQLTRITKDRKCLPEDGKIDSLATACAQWVDLTRLDPEQQAEKLDHNSKPERLVKEAESIIAGRKRRQKKPRFFSHRYFDGG